MAYAIVFVVGIISAYLFDLMPVAKNTGLIFELQRKSISAIRKQYLTDEQKQGFLLISSGKLLLVTLKLIFLFGIAMLPFTIFALAGPALFKIGFNEILLSASGIAISCLAFIFYFFVKKVYGRFRL
jgi:hypothetical protein